MRKRTKDREVRLTPADRDLFDHAWKITRENHGNRFTFYLPGMIRYGNMRGSYPALSLTGNGCELLCEHCKGLLLDPMISAPTPEILREKCVRLARSGHSGVLLSGGCDAAGRLPWKAFLKTIAEIKSETDLFVSVHSGFLDQATARALKEAGVDQALLDVMGDEETAKEIYHLDGLRRVIGSLENLFEAGLEVVPHIVAGLMHCSIEAEYEALNIIRQFEPAALVIVVLNPLRGTPMATLSPLRPVEVARLIAGARLLMPEVPLSLGCERPRNRESQIMEELALCAGATRMATWSERTVEVALHHQLKPFFQPTCCSVPCREEHGRSLSVPLWYKQRVPSR